MVSGMALLELSERFYDIQNVFSQLQNARKKENFSEANFLSNGAFFLESNKTTEIFSGGTLNNFTTSSLWRLKW